MDISAGAELREGVVAPDRPIDFAPALTSHSGRSITNVSKHYTAEERVAGELSMATTTTHHLTMLVEVHRLISIHFHLYQFYKTMNEPN